MARDQWQRARRPDEVEARKQEILLATSRLLRKTGLSELSLTAIAKESGLSKANLYRYFESRDAILLVLFTEELREWTQNLKSRLIPISRTEDISEVAQATADSFEGRDQFCLLLSALAPQLEWGLPREAIVAEKRAVRDHFVSLIEPLRQALPGFSKAQANEFLIMTALFAMGLWPQAAPSPKAKAAVEEPDLIGLAMNFSERIRWHSLILLRGLEGLESPRVRSIPPP